MSLPFLPDSHLLLLLRPRLCLLVALSGLAGVALAGGLASPLALVVPAALFVLAAAGSMANQALEPEIDRRMQRTASRPVASGRLTPRAALALALALTSGASLLLYYAAAPMAAAVGLAALALYLAVYTPLKHRSVWALLPGALCGSLPPLVGWTAAGGPPASGLILLPVFTLFLWQMPHFWLLAWRHREDYVRAGLPSLHALIGPAALARLTRIWLAALVPATLLWLPMGVVVTWPARLLVLATLLTLVLAVLHKAPRAWDDAGLARCFHLANLVMTALMAALVLDGGLLLSA